MLKNQAAWMSMVLVIGLSGCNGKSNEAGGGGSNHSNAAKAQTPVGTVTGRENSLSSDDARLPVPLCANPIELNPADAGPLLTENNRPSGRLHLKRLRFYMYNPETNETFIVSADASKNFETEVECNGTARPATKETIFNRSGSFSIAEWVEFGKKNSPKKRQIGVKFENAQVIAKTSSQIPSKDQAVMGEIGNKIDRLESGRDTFVSVRLFSTSPTEVQTRVLFEYPAIEKGIRVVQYAEAVYSSR